MRRWIALIVCVGCAVSLVGCGGVQTPQEVMKEFASLYPMPPGRVYVSNAREGEAGYLPREVYTLLYGRESGGDDKEDVEEYAIFLGSSLTCVYEMGIFLCPDKDSAYEMLGTLEGRLATLRATPLTDTSATRDAFLGIYGRVVVYTVLPDNQKAAHVLGRLL